MSTSSGLFDEHTGPHARSPGYGTLLAGLAGFYALTGWPNDLHLRGTIEAWKSIGSTQQWLDIHGGKGRAEFYSDWGYARQNERAPLTRRPNAERAGHKPGG